MSLALTQSATAVGTNKFASFLAVDGTSPYVYSVVPGGAGGSINASSGAYTSPTVLDSDPSKNVDTIQVEDGDGNTATADILVTSPLGLVCDIIQKEMNLSNGRVYFWDQKIIQPYDHDLYVAVSILTCKPFGNTNRFHGDVLAASAQSLQSVNMLAVVEFDVISRGPAARDRKEELIAALKSDYAQRQQEANAFFIGNISSTFMNLSQIDGAAIPYRFKISTNLQYFVEVVSDSEFFSDFQTPSLVTDS